jgi:hypothetical protein
MADRGTDMVSDRTGLGVVWCLSLPDLRVTDRDTTFAFDDKQVQLAAAHTPL